MLCRCFHWAELRDPNFEQLFKPLKAPHTHRAVSPSCPQTPHRHTCIVMHTTKLKKKKGDNEEPFSLALC